MKKVLVLIIFLLFPIYVDAAIITDVRISGPTTLNKGESAELLIDIDLEDVDPKYLIALGGGGVALTYNKSAIVLEDAYAANSVTIISGDAGYREIASIIELKEDDDVSFETNCSNNVFCNNFKIKVKIFAKEAGVTTITANTGSALLYDLSKADNFSEDTMMELEYNAQLTHTIEILDNGLSVIVPEEVASTPTTKPIVPKTTTPQVTTQPTTEIPTIETPTTVQPEETTTAKLTDEEKEALKADQELRKRTNKKIFTYSAIVIAIIILLVIANVIINKIKYRNLEKALNKL